MIRIKALDGWRGLAILAVLIGHFVPRADWLAPFGVELFFVLSGRLMAQILIYERFPIKEFYLRRLSRIFPTLYVFLVLVAALAIIQQIAHFKSPPTATVGGLISAATMTFNYWYVTFGHSSALDHIWSLCVEEHSYIVLGLIALLVGRHPSSAMRLAAVLAIMAAVNGWIESLTFTSVGAHNLYWRTDVRSFSIFSGFSIFIALKEFNPHQRFLKLVSPLCLVMAGIFAFLFPDQIRFTVGTILLAVAVGLLERGSYWFTYILTSRGLTFLGVISYSCYLWQELGLKFGSHVKHVPTLVWICPVAVVTLISFYFVEQPSRQWLNARSANRRIDVMLSKQVPVSI